MGSEYTSVIELTKIFPKIDDLFIENYLFPGSNGKNRITYVSQKEEVIGLVEYYFKYPDEIDTIVFVKQLMGLEGIDKSIKKPENIKQDKELALFFFGDA